MKTNAGMCKKIRTNQYCFVSAYETDKYGTGTICHAAGSERKQTSARLLPDKDRVTMKSEGIGFSRVGDETRPGPVFPLFFKQLAKNLGGFIG